MNMDKNKNESASPEQSWREPLSDYRWLRYAGDLASDVRAEQARRRAPARRAAWRLAVAAAAGLAVLVLSDDTDHPPAPMPTSSARPAHLDTPTVEWPRIEFPRSWPSPAWGAVAAPALSGVPLWQSRSPSDVAPTSQESV